MCYNHLMFEDKIKILNQELKEVKEIKENDSKWSSMRRIIATSIICAILLTYIGYKIYPRLFPAPTCSDAKQNGQEGGVDCGGACELMCAYTYKPLKIIYSNYFKNKNGNYDLVTLVENDNSSGAPKVIRLSYELYDSSGLRLGDESIESYSSYGQVIPVIKKDYVSKDGISNMRVTLGDYKVYKKDKNIDLRLKDYTFENGSSPSLKITYESLGASKTPIILLALLKDSLGNISNYAIQNSTKLEIGNQYVANFFWASEIKGEVSTVELIPVYN